MRICSLLPGATEIAFELDLGDQIVGVTHECDFPAAAREKPIVVRSVIDPHSMSSHEIDRRVGETLRAGKSLYMIDEEAFRNAAPDLILTQELCDVCAVDYHEVLEAAGNLKLRPQVLALAPHGLADVLNDIVRVGEVTARRDNAAALLRALRQRIGLVREAAAWSASRPRIVCLEWFDPLYVAGHWVPEMVELAGGDDGFGRKGEPSAEVEWAQVVKLQPEVVVLMPCGFDLERTMKEVVLLRGLPGWNDLPAVKSGDVFAVNGHAYFSRPGPRLIDGLEMLAQIIHPELFPRKAPPQAVQRIL